MNELDHVESAYLREETPEFAPGDTVRVHVRVVEAGRERVQIFEGVVIARDGGGLSETFTVRQGVGMANSGRVVRVVFQGLVPDTPSGSSRRICSGRSA